MKKKMFLVMLSVVICMIACQKDGLEQNSIIEQSNIHTRNIESLCFTSYNIHAFCEGIGPNTIDNDPVGYAQDICNVLDAIDSDVINLQEVWCAEVQEAILNCIGSDYIDFMYDEESGLMTLSKLEFDREESVHFTGPEAGADVFKNKGYLSVQVTSGCCSFNIINTHLQADIPFEQQFINLALTVISKLFSNSSGEMLVRDLQLVQLREHIERLSNCVPTIIGGDFNIDTETEEFDKLITLMQGQPIQLITNGPTSINSGTTLDYFILSNYENHEENIGSMTTTIHDCIEEEIITRWNVFEIDLYDYPSQGYLVASFETQAEAEEYKNQLEENSDPTDWLLWRVSSDVTKKCHVQNESDHHPIETCIEDYDCEEQLQCIEDSIIVPCDPPCPYNFICIDGQCQEVFDGGCHPPCNDTEFCVNGNCVPL